MTKPREKTREELQAEIEDGKKKIRQFENREKMQRPTCVCHRLIPVLIFREEEQKDKREKIRSFVLE